MSKKKSKHLLISGAEGWELWNGSQCVQSYAERLASEIPKPPPSPFVLAFAVREATALPMVVPSTDEELLEELVEMHYERTGVMPDHAAGKLDDFFVVSKGAESSAVLALVLRPQTERDLPRRSAAQFELSARCFRPEEDGIYLWREFGLWVFAIYLGGELLYFQALRQEALDGVVAREIHLSLSQLEMQGLVSDRLPVTVWDLEVDVSALEQAMPRSVVKEARPAPQLPPKASSLLPADVAAERRAARQKVRNVLIAVLLVVALIMGGAIVGKDYFDLRKERERLALEVEALKPDAEVARELIDKRNELAPLINEDLWPQELLLQCARSLPAGRKVRFRKFDVVAGDDGKPRQIEIEGEAQESNFKAISDFRTLLERNNRLKGDYSKEMPNAQLRKGMWVFKWVFTNKNSLNQ